MAILGCALAAGVGAEPGVSARQVVVGMSVPLSGPLAAQGQALRDGLKAAFDGANADGGVLGRKLLLRVLDDGGDAARAAAAARSLLADDEGVIALTGFVGSAAFEALTPILSADKTPFIGLATSAEPSLALAAKPLFLARAGVQEQISAVLNHCEHVGIDKIALVTQTDALGQQGWDSLHAQLVQAAMRPAAALRLASTDGTTPALARVVQELRDSGARAVLLGLEGPQALAMVQALHRAGWTPTIYVLHDAWATLTAQSHAKELAGVVVVLALPSLEQRSHRLVGDYRRQIALGGTAGSTAGLEGYLSGRLIIEALLRCPRQPSRACLVDELNGRAHEVAGYRLQFAATKRRGSRWTELAVVRSDGRLER